MRTRKNSVWATDSRPDSIHLRRRQRLVAIHHCLCETCLSADRFHLVFLLCNIMYCIKYAVCHMQHVTKPLTQRAAAWKQKTVRVRASRRGSLSWQLPGTWRVSVIDVFVVLKLAHADTQELRVSHRLQAGASPDVGASWHSWALPLWNVVCGPFPSACQDSYNASGSEWSMERPFAGELQNVSSIALPAFHLRFCFQNRWWFCLHFHPEPL